MQVYYDASGYDSGDSDIDKDRQLSILHSGHEQYDEAPRYGKWDITEDNDTLKKDVSTAREDNIKLHQTEKVEEGCPNARTNPSNKPVKQTCITHYFGRCTKDSTFSPSNESGVHQNPDISGDSSSAARSNQRTAKVSTEIERTDHVDSSRKVSIAVNTGDSSITGTPRTPRRLSFRLPGDVTQTPKEEKYDKNSFFHTPPARRKIAKNMRQTPSRTAPDFTQRRRSTRLQAKFAALEDKTASESKIHVLVNTLKFARDLHRGNSNGRTGCKPKKSPQIIGITDNNVSNEIEKRKRGRPPKNTKGTMQSDNNMKIDSDQSQNKVISLVKFYGTRSKSHQEKDTVIHQMRNNRDQPVIAKQLSSSDNVSDVDEDEDLRQMDALPSSQCQTGGMVPKYSQLQPSSPLHEEAIRHVKTEKVIKTNQDSTNVITKKRKGGRTKRVSFCDIKTGTVDINVLRKKKRTNQPKYYDMENIEGLCALLSEVFCFQFSRLH